MRGCGRSSLTPPARRREPGSCEENPEEQVRPARRHHASHRAKFSRPLDTSGPHGCRRAYADAVAEQSAPVEPAHPPAAFLRVSNPVVRLLLRSPAGGPMRKQFMVLRFTGRKTGRRYDIPVVAHRLGGELYSLTDARWRHNFRDGADLEVTLDGQD